MSILIKGMEMPINRGVKVINVFSDGKVTYAYDLNNKQIATAVPILPHGRLIDADALPWENQGKMLTDPDEWGLKVLDIENAPTIIEAEEQE